MHTEKTLFELQSQVESVNNVTEAIKDLKLLADFSLKAFNVPPQEFDGIKIYTRNSVFNFDRVNGSVVFEQWVVSHLKPALQHLCEMSVSEVHGLKRALHHLTRPEETTDQAHPLAGQIKPAENPAPQIL